MLNLTDMKKRRNFDHEYKQMAADLSYKLEGISALAVELDIGADLIYRWRREAEAFKDSSFPVQGNKILTEEQKEITRLRKELRDAQKEHDAMKLSLKESILVEK